MYRMYLTIERRMISECLHAMAVSPASMRTKRYKDLAECLGRVVGYGPT